MTKMNVTLLDCSCFYYQISEHMEVFLFTDLACPPVIPVFPVK